MKELRERIDAIDRQLLKLLDERMETAGAIGRYKEAHNLPMYDPAREKAKLESLGELAAPGKRPYMERIMAKIMEQCRTFEEDRAEIPEAPRYGLLGRRLGHSYSPQIHRALGGYDFGLFEKEPEEIEGYMRSDEFDGLCVTIPYKREVMKYCSEISEVAWEANSVNTIVRRSDGSLYGDNTDYFGFRYMVEREGFPINGAKCIVLGSGGVSGTVKKALEDMGAASVTLISRKGEDNYDNISRHYDGDIVVNATPVGMYPDTGVSPVDITRFTRCKGAIDLIYNPLRTKFILDAQRVGIPACGGMKMLVAQAAKGCALFTGKETSDIEIDRITAVTEIEQGNIVLIGMPGAGKTSIGRELALLTGRKFLDLDEMIEEETGRAPSVIIETEGERAFRELETGTLAKALTGGVVLACGGGVVTSEVNRDIIRSDSTVVYVKRDLSQLATGGRPLSKTMGVEVLYAERGPVYEAWSDIRVDNIGITETAEEIAAILGFAERDN
ncbi:MAG: shikimate kinase [Lentihominibacter sp.]